MAVRAAHQQPPSCCAGRATDVDHLRQQHPELTEQHGEGAPPGHGHRGGGEGISIGDITRPETEERHHGDASDDECEPTVGEPPEGGVTELRAAAVDAAADGRRRTDPEHDRSRRLVQVDGVTHVVGQPIRVVGERRQGHHELAMIAAERECSQRDLGARGRAQFDTCQVEVELIGERQRDLRR